MNDEGKPASTNPENEEAGAAAEGSGDSGLTRRGFVAAVGATTVAAATLGKGVARAATATFTYRIHPAIGVARVGNAEPDTFFIGPEIPGRGPLGDLPGTIVPEYKVNGLLKPQGARFRIWRYVRDANGQVSPDREVNLGSGDRIAAIEWTVHVANRKSAFYEENGPAGEMLPAGPLRNPGVSDRGSLQNDFGPRKISGQSQGPVEFRASNASGPTVTIVKRPDGVTPVIDYLGQLRTDAEGRLIFLGGRGKSASNLDPPPPLGHWSNNNNWFDDIADGPVTATITFDDGSRVDMDPAGNAWVLTAPPDFAPRIGAAISLYDVLYDMGVRSFQIPNNTLYQTGGPLDRLRQLHALWNPSAPFEFGSFQPDYWTEIHPLLIAAVNFVYVTGLVNFKHSSMLDPSLGDPSGAAAKTRKGVFTYLRPPDKAAGTDNATGPGTMPKLYGDNWYQGAQNFKFTFFQNGTGNAGGGGQSFPTPAHIPQFQRFLTVTPTQYGLLREWNAGNFLTGLGSPPPPESQIAPHGLDRAALENCIGGAFYPGIECGWQMRNPRLFIEPFRIDFAAVSQYLDQNGNPEGTPISAGHFSRQMAVPWQADFNDCSKLLNLGWWPSQRPDDVFLNASDALKDRVPWARADGKWPSGSFTSSHEDMVANWWKFGFVVETFGGFVESERAAHVP